MEPPYKRRKTSHRAVGDSFIADHVRDRLVALFDAALDAENESSPCQLGSPTKREDHRTVDMEALQQRIQDLESELAQEKEKTKDLQKMLGRARGEISESLLANIGTEPTTWQQILRQEEGLDVRNLPMPEDEIPRYVRMINQVTPFVVVLIDSDSVDNQLPGFMRVGERGSVTEHIVDAATILDLALQNTISNQNPPGSTIPKNAQIMVRGFLNLEFFLRKFATLEHDTAHWYRCFKRFNRYSGYFSLQDSGPGSQKADRMIYQMFKLFLPNPSCRGIWIAGCNDVGYLDVALQVLPFQRADVADKFRFLRFQERPMPRRYLSLQSRRPDLFINLDLPE